MAISGQALISNDIGKSIGLLNPGNAKSLCSCHAPVSGTLTVRDFTFEHCTSFKDISTAFRISTVLPSKVKAQQVMLQFSKASTQDENSAFKLTGKQHGDAENPKTAKKRGNGPTLPAGSARKALGNITNQSHCKTPAPVPRKALGDITNATPVPVGNTATVHKPLQINNSRIPGDLLSHKPVKVRPLEEVWAEEGIEALAGKGWQDLEAEQIARENLEIRARAAFQADPTGEMTRAEKAASSAPLSRPPSRPLSPIPGDRLADDVDTDLLDLLPKLTSPRPVLCCIDEDL